MEIEFKPLHLKTSIKALITEESENIHLSRVTSPPRQKNYLHLFKLPVKRIVLYPFTEAILFSSILVVLDS